MTNYQSVLKKTKSLVKKNLGSDSSGHDYYHCQRVVNMAIKIGKKEGADLKVLELAGWLHDIAVLKDKPHHENTGAKKAQRFLTKLKVDPNLVKQITSCIQQHRFSKNIKPSSLEAKIIQDADKLDAIGAIAIARVFMHAGHANQTIYNPKLKPSLSYYLKHGQSNTTLNHFKDKLFKLKNLLHTKSAKQLSIKRHRFMKQYLNQFLAEWSSKE